MNILLTGAAGVTSRAVVRSLKMSSHFAQARIVGTDICKNQFGPMERLCDKYYKTSHVESPAYVQEVEAILKQEKIDAALIMTEKESLNWSHHSYPTRYLVPPPRFSKIAISKQRIHEAFSSLGIVPKFIRFNPDDFDRNTISQFLQEHGKAWVRSISEGSTSGIGALLIQDMKQLDAWLTLNPASKELMISEYLPGGNYACNLLYHEGKLVKYAIYERLEYFMAHLVPSGISGNITRGKLINDQEVFRVSTQAVDHLIQMTGETMTGLVTADLKSDAKGRPNITEINLRHTAATSAFASGGANMAEAQVLATLGRASEVGPLETKFPEDNLLLRDIDGVPLWLANATEQLQNQIHTVTI